MLKLTKIEEAIAALTKARAHVEIARARLDEAILTARTPRAATVFMNARSQLAVVAQQIIEIRDHADEVAGLA